LLNIMSGSAKPAFTCSCVTGDEGTGREGAPTRITSISISSYRSTTPRSPTSSMSRRKSSASNSICTCFWSSSYFSTTWKIPASSFSTPPSHEQSSSASSKRTPGPMLSASSSRPVHHNITTSQVLPMRQGIVGICKLPFHPRIDHVNDLEMIGRAHKDGLRE